jgi:hypothetical protein
MPYAYTRAPLGTLATAEAAHNDAEHAVEAARLSGCALAVFGATNRRARAYSALLTARREADPAAADQAEAERQRNEIGYASPTL